MMGDYQEDRQEYIPASRGGRLLQRPLSAHVSNRPIPPPALPGPLPKAANFGNGASPYRRIHSAAPYRPPRPVSANYQPAPVAAWGDSVPQTYSGYGMGLAGAGSLPGLFSGMEASHTYQRPDNTRSVPSKEPENMEEELRKMRLALSGFKEQNRLLRTERQRLEEELARARTNLVKAEEILNTREKALSPTIGMSQMYRTPATTALVSGLREQVKTLRAEKDRFKGDLEELLRTTKATRVAELQSEAHALSQELSRQQEMTAIMRYRMEDAEAMAAAAHGKAKEAEAMAREYTEAGSTLPPGPVRLAPGNTISSSRVRKTMLAIQQSHRVLLSQAALLRAVFPPGMSMEAFAAKAALKAPTAGGTEVLRYLRFHLNKLQAELGSLPGGRGEDDLETVTSATPPAAPKPPRPRPGRPRSAGCGPVGSGPADGSKPVEPSSDPRVLLQGVADLVRELRSMDMDGFMARPDMEADVDQLADVASLLLAEHKRLTGAETQQVFNDDTETETDVSDNPLYQPVPSADPALVPKEITEVVVPSDGDKDEPIKVVLSIHVGDKEAEPDDEVSEANEAVVEDQQTPDESELKAEPNVETNPEAEAEPEAEPEVVVADPEPEAEPKAEPEAGPEAEAHPEAEAEPSAEPSELAPSLPDSPSEQLPETSSDIKAPSPLQKESSSSSRRSAPDTPVKHMEGPASSIGDPAEYGTRRSSVAGSMYSARGWQPEGAVLTEEDDEMQMAEIAVAAVAAAIAAEAEVEKEADDKVGKEAEEEEPAAKADEPLQAEPSPLPTPRGDAEPVAPLELELDLEPHGPVGDGDDDRPKRFSEPADDVYADLGPSASNCGDEEPELEKEEQPVEEKHPAESDKEEEEDAEDLGALAAKLVEQEEEKLPAANKSVLADDEPPPPPPPAQIEDKGWWEEPSDAGKPAGEGGADVEAEASSQDVAAEAPPQKAWWEETPVPTEDGELAAQETAAVEADAESEPQGTAAGKDGGSKKDADENPWWGKESAGEEAEEDGEGLKAAGDEQDGEVDAPTPSTAMPDEAEVWERPAAQDDDAEEEKVQFPGDVDDDEMAANAVEGRDAPSGEEEQLAADAAMEEEEEDPRPPAADDDERAPAADDDEPAPAADDDEPAPAADDDEPAPAADDNEPAPAADDDEPAPAADDDEPAPAADDDEPAPVADDDEPAPAADDDEPAPAADDDEPAPAGDDDEPAPVADDDEPAPAADDDERAPAADDDEPAPAGDDDEPAPVANDDEPAPAGDDDEPAPAHSPAADDWYVQSPGAVEDDGEATLPADDEMAGEPVAAEDDDVAAKTADDDDFAAKTADDEDFAAKTADDDDFAAKTADDEDFAAKTADEDDAPETVAADNDDRPTAAADDAEQTPAADDEAASPAKAQSMPNDWYDDDDDAALPPDDDAAVKEDDAPDASPAYADPDGEIEYGTAVEDGTPVEVGAQDGDDDIVANNSPKGSVAVDRDDDVDTPVAAKSGAADDDNDGDRLAAAKAADDDEDAPGAALPVISPKAAVDLDDDVYNAAPTSTGTTPTGKP